MRYGNQLTPPVKEGQEVDVTIEAVGEKGDGVAKVQGFVLFVPNTQQGQRKKVRITRVLSKVGFAEVVGDAAPATETPAEQPAQEESFDANEHLDSEDFGDESEADNSEEESDDSENEPDEESPEDSTAGDIGETSVADAAREPPEDEPEDTPDESAEDDSEEEQSEDSSSDEDADIPLEGEEEKK